MAEFEQKYIQQLIKDKSTLFLRYIDIFMVLIKSEKQLKDFMKEQNQKHPSIKFDYEFGSKQIKFLGTFVSVDKKNKVKTTLLRKPSGRQNFSVDTGRKLNVHKTFRRRPGRFLNILCTFNLRPVSTGFLNSFMTQVSIIQ